MMLLVAHNDVGNCQLRHALKRHRQWLWYDVNVLTTMKWTMILTMTKMDETPVRYGLTASLRRWHTMSNSNKCWRHMVPVAVAEGWGGNSLEINWKCAHSLEINWKSFTFPVRFAKQHTTLWDFIIKPAFCNSAGFGENCPALLALLLKVERKGTFFSTPKTYPTRNCKTLLVSPCC